MARQSTVVLTIVVFVVVIAGYVFGRDIWKAFEAPKVAPPPPILAPKGVLRYESGAPQLTAIKTHPVQEFPVPLAEPLNARIAYNENFTARLSAPISGRIVSLRGQPGEAVRAGEMLLSLDSPDMAAAVSDLYKARADEERKKRALDRSRELLEGGVIPRKDLESADADFQQASAETRRAAERLRNIAPSATSSSASTTAANGGGQPARYELRSPISGVVAERKANPGMEVRPDLPDPLFVVTDPTRLWVLIDLPERDLGKVTPGAPVSVEVDAYPGQSFAAKIENVAEVVDPATRRVQVRCFIANPERKLKPEMYARVTLLSERARKAVRVPNSAIVTEGLYSFLFVEKEPGTFERRRINFVVQDRDYSYLDSGAAVGERIVVAGAVLLSSQLGLGQ